MLCAIHSFGQHWKKGTSINAMNALSNKKWILTQHWAILKLFVFPLSLLSVHVLIYLPTSIGLGLRTFSSLFAGLSKHKIWPVLILSRDFLVLRRLSGRTDFSLSPSFYNWITQLNICVVKVMLLFCPIEVSKYFLFYQNP